MFRIGKFFRVFRKKGFIFEFFIYECFIYFSQFFFWSFAQIRFFKPNARLRVSIKNSFCFIEFSERKSLRKMAIFNGIIYASTSIRRFFLIMLFEYKRLDRQKNCLCNSRTLSGILKESGQFIIFVRCEKSNFNLDG